MQITFNHSKNQKNIARHGISLAFGEELDWDEALAWRDDKEQYTDQRMICLVPSGDKLYFAAFVDDPNDIEVRTVISIRLATQTEVKSYVKNYI